MSGEESIIVVNNISKKYYKKGSNKPFWALKNLSFEVGKGEIVGIIGRNGAGKSTLLRILSDVIQPSEGTIKYKGNILSILDIGTGFHPDLTGLENIYLNASLLGMKKSETQTKVEEIIEFSGIKDFIKEPVKSYSNGMYLRLALSIALFVDSDILLLDEVVSVGDAEFRFKAINRIKEQTRLGRTCLIISHDLASISMLCDKCLLMDDGNVLFYGKSKDVIDNYFDLVYKDLKNKSSIVDSAKCKLIELSISQENYFIDEPVNIKIVYDKKVDEKIDVVIKIRNYNSPVLTDCEIYRPEYAEMNYAKGVYAVDCTIPPNLFNAGAYFVDIILGDKINSLVEVQYAKKFMMHVREWESKKLWNEENEIIPFRPICTWKISPLFQE